MRGSILLAALVASGCGSAGSSDGPRVVRENLEWLDVQVPEADANDLPRVLLVGDSILRWYGPEVGRALEGKAYVARLATSKGVGDPALLAEVALVLGQARFDVVHFNNGLHGFGYAEEEYRGAFPEFVETLRRGARGATLIWASSTPIRRAGRPGEFDPRTGRVKARNAIAAAVVGPRGIAVDDLFGLVVDRPELYDPDGVHFNPRGVAAQAEQVAATIRAALEGRARAPSAGDHAEPREPIVRPARRPE